MYPIVQKQILAQDIKRIDIAAGQIAAKAQAGQFVMVTPSMQTQPFPMTIIDADERKGTISLIVQEIGSATRSLGAMPIGQQVHLIMGPLGRPALMDRYGQVICIATGMGAAQILPVCRALKKRGNKVIGIIGAKSKKILMLEAQMRVVCDELFITTNDGSYERKGLATSMLQELMVKYKVNAIYAAGSVDMMRSASAMARDKGIPIRVTLNPYMATGMGLCGSCRVRVGGEFRLACSDGPEFNGYDVDYDDLLKRDDALKEKRWVGSNHPSSPKKEGFQAMLKPFWGTGKNKT